ncbi:DUF2264 domain-containing protein [Pseudonocardia kunmingensis]|uniref:DUF2264 domain-containing protein n=1 Tax=Pseudonocardia kunmingensis TaxID=630975 RepID=A0A543D0N4_9PSEU|nr:DUF2264 domain-containing protein [Pseudonocardia kunmingensis]TQM02909.1 hypothetical protein FB558_7552 [Pseudonocardia kunmingensis]
MTPVAPDHALSPHTGWTRAHWADLADRMLAAVDPFRSPGGARVDLPGPASRYGPASDGLEGFARTFLLAGFRVAGERGADPEGLLERYARGLAAGTDPHSPEAWPRPDELGQAKVEAASIALVLQLTRPWLWDRLDDGVRERVVAWLATVVGQDYPPINWVWFRVVVESFLREVGGPWSRADVEEDLAVHASFRRPGGWLSDGAERAFDHYTGWALHLYPLLWAHWFDVEALCPPELRRQWADDLARYLDDAVRLVGADGAPLVQGRSLVYRFAAAAPFWVGAVTGEGGQHPGLVRRAASGIAGYFADRGAFGPDGLLSLGWHGAWPPMRQAYSGPGSPYWAAKGMLGLALAADHPVWTAPEQPLPVESGDQARVLEAPGWLLSARRRDGIAVVLNHGTDHAHPGDTRADSPLYARLGYSTATLPPLTGAGVTDPVDNAVVLLDGAGRATHRTGFRTLYARDLGGGVLAAASAGPVRWVDTGGDDSADHGSGRTGPVVPGPGLTVASVLRDGVEVRLARIDDHTGGSWGPLRLGGWPVAPAGDTAAAATEATATSVTGLRSSVQGLCGFTEAAVHVERGTSPLGEVAIPYLLTPPGLAPGTVVAALVTLDRAGEPPPRPTVTAEYGTATITWRDGTQTPVALPRPWSVGAKLDA